MGEQLADKAQELGLGMSRKEGRLGVVLARMVGAVALWVWVV